MAVLLGGIGATKKAKKLLSKKEATKLAIKKAKEKAKKGKFKYTFLFQKTKWVDMEPQFNGFVIYQRNRDLDGIDINNIREKEWNKDGSNVELYDVY